MDITPKLRIESETEHTRVDFDVEFGDFGGDEEFDPLMQIAYPALRDGMDEAFDEPNQNELVKDAFDKEIKRNVVSLFDSKRRSLAPCPMMAIYDRTTGGEE